MRALRTVGAIFGARAGFYGEQAAELNFFRLVEFAMGELGLKYQFRQRKIEEGANFVARPIMANLRCGHSGIVLVQASAMSSISTRTSRGRRATSTVARAGGAAAKYLP